MFKSKRCVVVNFINIFFIKKERKKKRKKVSKKVSKKVRMKEIK